MGHKTLFQLLRPLLYQRRQRRTQRTVGRLASEERGEPFLLRVQVLPKVPRAQHRALISRLRLWGILYYSSNRELPKILEVSLKQQTPKYVQHGIFPCVPPGASHRDTRSTLHKKEQSLLSSQSSCRTLEASTTKPKASGRNLRGCDSKTQGLGGHRTSLHPSVSSNAS